MKALQRSNVIEVIFMLGKRLSTQLRSHSNLNGKFRSRFGWNRRYHSLCACAWQIIIRLDPNDPAAEPVLVDLATKKQDRKKNGPMPLLPDYRPQDFLLVMSSLDKYCRDDAISESEYLATRKQPDAGFMESPHGMVLSEGLFERVVKYVLPHYSRADLLANYYHKRYTRANVGLFALTTFAVTAATAQKLCPAPLALWIVAELAALIVALAWLVAAGIKIAF